ncbi:MAG: ATP-binding cassette domain-containing protein [Clostridia bacterium]|nr:ATP-binding cassette domain-containing protein [Clostridia bacterium]
MKMMLPLDRLSSAAEAAVREKGLDPDALSVAVRMDLDFDGNFGESWLIYEKDTRLIHRLLSDPDSIPAKTRKRRSDPDELGKTVYAEKVSYFDSFSLDYNSDLTVDTCLSSTRLLVLKHETRRPDLEGIEDKEEKDMLLGEWNEGAVTEIKAQSTNASRQRLFAFCEIVDRFLRGDEITEDDPIFEQFNAKCPKCGRVYENQFRKVCPHCQNKNATLSRLLEFLKPYKKHVALVVVCMLASSALSLVTPIINGKILYDRVIESSGQWHTVTKLFIVLSVVVALALLSLLINIIQNRTNATLSTRMMKEMKQRVFDSMLNLSLSYFNKNTTGRLINRVNYDAERIRSFYIDGLPPFIINALNFIGLTFFLFWLNPKMTLIVFIPVPVIVVIFRVMLPKLWRMFSKQYRASSSMNSMLGDSLNGIRVVKAFAKEAEETNRFYKYSDRLYATNLKVNITALTIFPLVSLLIGLSSQAIWGFGGLQVMGQHMTYGEFTTYLGYIGMIFGPLQFFSTFTNLVTDTMNAAQRMFEILDMVPEVMDDHDPIDKETFDGDIEFKNVSFHYNPNRPILKDVNIKIHAGDNIGLVGHTGSGKSTIANLITRMYDPISGQILVDGVDLKKIRMSSIRKNIAIVSQEIFLFRGTIADNIRYARPDATMEEIIAAAKAANAHDFIVRLPEGYETEVGSGSRSLSGGERQRVSIARALLMSPSILILDEATAAMDTETERLISDALSKLVEGRTCITIAHRLSTLKDCNYLFVIENGEIAEEGPPDELLARGGTYYKLYKLQSEAMKKVLSGM